MSTNSRTMIEALQRDDLDYIRSLMSFEILPKTRFHMSDKNLPEILQTGVSFIQAAAYYGSIKCFNFFFNTIETMYASVTDFPTTSFFYDRYTNNLIYFALFGANQMILNQLTIRYGSQISRISRIDTTKLCTLFEQTKNVNTLFRFFIKFGLFESTISDINYLTPLIISLFKTKQFHVIMYFLNLSASSLSNFKFDMNLSCLNLFDGQDKDQKLFSLYLLQHPQVPLALKANIYFSPNHFNKIYLSFDSFQGSLFLKQTKAYGEKIPQLFEIISVFIAQDPKFFYEVLSYLDLSPIDFFTMKNRHGDQNLLAYMISHHHLQAFHFFINYLNEQSEIFVSDIKRSRPDLSPEELSRITEPYTVRYLLMSDHSRSETIVQQAIESYNPQSKINYFTSIQPYLSYRDFFLPNDFDNIPLLNMIFSAFIPPSAILIDLNPPPNTIKKNREIPNYYSCMSRFFTITPLPKRAQLFVMWWGHPALDWDYLYQSQYSFASLLCTSYMRSNVLEMTLLYPDPFTVLVWDEKIFLLEQDELMNNRRYHSDEWVLREINQSFNAILTSVNRFLEEPLRLKPFLKSLPNKKKK